MLTSAEFQTAVTSASAFIGALGGCVTVGWWLATKFNRVYERISEVEKNIGQKLVDHEKEDLRRFGEQDIAIARCELYVGKTPYQT